MDLSAYAQLAVRLANAAVDGKDETPADDDCDNISSLDGLRTLLTNVELPNTRLSRSDLDAMHALRTEFREIFAVCADGNGAKAVDRLNALLIQHPVHPQISNHDGKPWHLHLTQSGTVADRYAAGAAMGMATLLTGLGPDRLGICQGISCDRVFIDTGVSSSGPYCSERCAAKTNVTEIRKRRRTGGTAAMPTAAV